VGACLKGLWHNLSQRKERDYAQSPEKKKKKLGVEEEVSFKDNAQRKTEGRGREKRKTWGGFRRRRRREGKAGRFKKIRSKGRGQAQRKGASLVSTKRPKRGQLGRQPTFGEKEKKPSFHKKRRGKKLHENGEITPRGKGKKRGGDA